MVGDAEPHVPAGGLDGEVDRGVGGRVLSGILHQVTDYFSDAMHIHAHAGQIRSYVDVDLPSVEGCLEVVQGDTDRACDVLDFQLELHLLRVQLGHLRSFADQTVQTVGFFFNDREQVDSRLFL